MQEKKRVSDGLGPDLSKERHYQTI